MKTSYDSSQASTRKSTAGTSRRLWQPVLVALAAMAAMAVSAGSVSAGELAVTAQAAQLGNFGLEVRLTDGNPAFLVDESPNGETEYRARFYINLNTLVMAGGDSFTLFEGRSAGEVLQFRVLVVRSGGTFQLRLEVREDGGAPRAAPTATHRGSGFRLVEVLWRAATGPGANDGAIRLFLDRLLIGELDNVDSDLGVVDRVRLGAVAGLDAGTLQTFFLDTFESRRANYIGPVQPFFNDTTGHFAFEFIDALFAAAVTTGCGGGSYCPNDPVTRAQMAIFLLRGAEGGDFNPPAVGASTGFDDVPTNHFAAAWIKELAERGITSGCSVSPRLYCPDNPVTRAQMAIFLLRARIPPIVPPTGSGTEFDDVGSGHFAVDFIEELAERGVTSGCSASPPLYCPSDSVTRGQMAIFLVRNFGLPLPFVP